MTEQDIINLQGVKNAFMDIQASINTIGDMLSKMEFEWLEDRIPASNFSMNDMERLLQLFEIYNAVEHIIYSKFKGNISSDDYRPIGNIESIIRSHAHEKFAYCEDVEIDDIHKQDLYQILYDETVPADIKAQMLMIGK